MFKIICVTNRALCEEDFLKRVEKIAHCGASYLILREKDLSEQEYEALARQVLAICRREGLPCGLHHFDGVAARLKADWLHLPLPDLEENPKLAVSDRTVGVSVHSVEQALRAQELGAKYVTAGHLFETDCKKGLPGRGVSFLREVCASVSIPVYAIGGICAENIAQVKQAGATGACLMSEFMRCPSPKDLVDKLLENLT